MRGVLLCLLLGAVTTVAVAWGVALKGGLFADPYHDNTEFTIAAYEPETNRSFTVYQSCQRTGLETHSVSACEVDWCSDPAELTRHPRPPVHLSEGRSVSESHSEFRFGLPWRAMWCANVDRQSSPPRQLLRMPWHGFAERNGLVTPNQQRFYVNSGLPIPKESFETIGYGVPLGVLPRGFALNTLSFGALWAVILFGLPAAYRLTQRTQRRLERGECVRCGYSRAGLAESAACPECGHTP